MTGPDRPGRLDESAAFGAEEATDAREYLRPIWRRKWLILFVTAVVTAVAYYASASQPNEYTSSTALLVNASDPSGGVLGDPNAYVDVDRYITNQMALLQTRGVAEEVARDLDSGISPDALLGAISTSQGAGPDFIQITATADDPEAAAAIANGFAATFVRLQRAENRAAAFAARTTAQQDLAELPITVETSLERSELRRRIERLRALETNPVSNARQLDAAVAPALPSAPRPRREALFGFAIALMMSIAAAYGLERFDRRLRTIDDVEAAYGLPMLGAIPQSGQVAAIRDGRPVLHGTLQEGFRSLRSNLQLAALDTPLQTVVVTSAISGEGKSSVVRNLALAYREAGMRVLVVEADLRHPTLPERFGEIPGPGLTEVLLGEARPDEAILEIDAQVAGLETLAQIRAAQIAPRANGNGGGNGHSGLGRLSLLPAGRLPANPTTVLGAARVAELIRELGRSHDVILIDSAPLLPVSDTVPLLTLADGVVLVTRLESTAKDTARTVTERLRRVPGANPVGVVVNDVPARSIRGSAYSYQYPAYGEQRETRRGRRRGRAPVETPTR